MKNTNAKFIIDGNNKTIDGDGNGGIALPTRRSIEINNVTMKNLAFVPPPRSPTDVVLSTSPSSASTRQGSIRRKSWATCL